VGCTPVDRQTAAGVVSAAAPLACTLVPVFAGAHGSFAGTVCDDLASLIEAILAAIPPHPGATAPCARLEPLTDSSGRPVGYMCPAYLETAKSALARRTP
jgi:hypothetical protein